MTEVLPEVSEQKPRVVALINKLNEQAAEKKYLVGHQALLAEGSLSIRLGNLKNE